MHEIIGCHMPYEIIIHHHHHIRFWYLRCCGCPGLQGRQHHQQTNTQFFYRSDALPVAQPTVSKH